MPSRPRRRVRANLIAFVVLTLVTVLLNGLLCVPPHQRAGETEEEEEHERSRATFGSDALRFQLMKLRDAYGHIPPNAYGSAKLQVDLLKWGGAVRRIEQMPAVDITSTLFADGPGAAAAASLITPQSWRWLGPGNVGGRIRALAIHPAKPDTIFAGSVGGGIWKTVNGGASWRAVDDFMPVLSVSSIVIDPANPNVMFAGTGEGYGNADSLRGAGIFRSADGGTSWSQLPETAAQFAAVTRLAISPAGNIVLAATNTGLWRSSNATKFTWINSGITPQDVDFHPSNLRRAIAAGYGSVVYSWDGGISWHRSSGLPPTSARIETAFARSQPDTVYALVDDRGGTLYRSSNGGASFRAVSTETLLDYNQGWYDAALWVNPRDSNHVVVGGVYLRQSFDGGASWQLISDGIHVDHHVIVESPQFDDAGNRAVFFGNDGGIYKTADIREVTGVGYTALNHDLGVTQFYGAAGNAESGTIVGGTQDNGTVLSEPAQATRWEQALPGDGGVVAADAADPSYFYAGLIYLQIQRSDDGGRGWSSISDEIGDVLQNANFIAPMVLDPSDSDRMLAGGTRLWRSTNVKSAKPSWTPIAPGAGGNYISAIAIAPGLPQIVWIGRNMGQIYRSTNATAAAPRFYTVRVPTAGNYVSRIAISAAASNVVYVATGSFGPRNLLKTVNGGATWSDATGSGATGLPDAPINDVEIDPSDPDTIYAGTEVGVFVSRNGGATWDLPQDGPANVSVDELFWMGTTLVAATHGRGMFAADSRGFAPAKADVVPAQLEFGTAALSTRTAPRRITIANSGGLPLTIYSLTVDAADAGYSIAASTCDGTLALGERCAIDVVFAPRAAGARQASIRVITNASNSEVWIPLSGAGVVPPPPAPAVPAPWTAQDIGDTRLDGSASGSSGSFGIKGAGGDIWGTADAFHFVHQSLAADGTIVARVESVQNIYPWTKAGLMIRAGTAANAAHVSLFVTPARGIALQSRTVAGGESVNYSVPGAAPRYLKLARVAKTITAYVSTDGVRWTKVGRQAFPRGTARIGLAVTSHDRARRATAMFNRVEVSGR